MRNGITPDVLLRAYVGDALPNMLASMRSSSNDSYPPFNIVRVNDDRFLIEVAAAGFAESELDVVVENDHLRISGRPNREQDKSRTYSYQGIARRSFERLFVLEKHMKVTSAVMENGILKVNLERRVPEELRPQRIAIEAS